MYVVLPYISPFEFEGEANTGDNVQLNCYVSKGDTPLSIKWLLNGKTTNKAPGISIISIGARTNLLTISSVQPEHAGRYTCSAENTVGVYEHSAELSIYGKHHTNQALIIFFVF